MASSGPENRFIQSIHRLLPSRVYRMKNHNPYLGGVADCWYSGAGGDLWVEYKFLTLPARASTIVDLCGGKNPPLSALQQEWLRGRHAEGRRVGAIIGTPDGGIWLPGIAWQVPLPSAEYAARVQTKASIASMITSLVSPPAG